MDKEFLGNSHLGGIEQKKLFVFASKGTGIKLNVNER